MDSIFLKPRSILLSPAKLDLMKAISPTKTTAVPSQEVVEERS
jgi:hypothetical protein